MNVWKTIFEWGSSLPDLLYPRICASCNKSLFTHEKILCLPCKMHLPETGYLTEPDNKCARVFWGRARLEHCSAFLHYRKGSHVQQLIHRLKYKGRQDIGEYLGDLYGKKIAQAGVLDDVDAIIPVPLHPKKERIRGYNQSLAIARGLSHAMKKPVWETVVRRKTHSASQTKKDRYSRWENAKEKFVLCDKNMAKGKHLLLVDDVITTGSTLESLASVFDGLEGVRLSVVSIGCSVI